MARMENTDSDERNDSGDCEPLPEHDLNDAPAECLLTPPVVSNRSIGTPRSHSRHRHRHRHHRRRSLFHFKRKESNFFAAISSMIVIVLLCAALAEPQWFYLRGGGCKDVSGNVINYLGVSQFFYSGKFLHTSERQDHPRTVYMYGHRDNEVLVNCITIQIVSIMNSIISLAFFGIGLSLMSFFLDLLGPTHKMLKVIRRHGVLNILTVAFCIVINGFCYWATENLSIFQMQTKPKTGSRIDVEFSIGFFLVTAAGAVSVVAAACNLLRYHSGSPATRQHGCHGDLDSLLSDLEGMDIGGDLLSQTARTSLPPPPPYTP